MCFIDTPGGGAFFGQKLSKNNKNRLNYSLPNFGNFLWPLLAGLGPVVGQPGWGSSSKKGIMEATNNC